MLRKGLTTTALVAALSIAPMQVKAEPITITIGLIIKAAITYFGGKAALAYGATKIIATKVGTVVLKKQTITLASGGTKVVVLAVSASAMGTAFARAGVPVELNDQSVELLSERAMDLFSDGERTMASKVYTGPDGKNYAVLDWMSCGDGETKTVELDLDDFLTVE